MSDWHTEVDYFGERAFTQWKHLEFANDEQYKIYKGGRKGTSE